MYLGNTLVRLCLKLNALFMLYVYALTALRFCGTRLRLRFLCSDSANKETHFSWRSLDGPAWPPCWYLMTRECSTSTSSLSPHAIIGSV